MKEMKKWLSREKRSKKKYESSFGCLLFMVQWQYETNATLATIDTIQPYTESYQDVVD